MITTIIMIALGVLILKGMLRLLGFAVKAAFWLIIGIPVAVFLFACGLIAVGAIVLAISVVCGILSLAIS